MTGVLLLTLYQRRLGTHQASGLHSICGSLSIASSLIDDGRLRTLSKCSANLFKIVSLSVRRPVPSATLYRRHVLAGYSIKQFSHMIHSIYVKTNNWPCRQ